MISGNGLLIPAGAGKFRNVWQLQDAKSPLAGSGVKFNREVDYGREIQL